MASSFISILSLNINKRINNEIENVINMMNEQKVHILLLQETANISKKTKHKLENLYNVKYFIHNPQQSKKINGVMCIISKYFQGELINVVNIGQQGRMQKIQIKCNNTELDIVNTYYPNEKQEQKNATILLNQHISINRTILAGDWNFVENVEKDTLRIGPRQQPYKSTKSDNFTELTNTYNLTDVWRDNHPNSKEYTYIQYFHSEGYTNTTHSRLDRFYIPATFHKYEPECSHQDTFFSDHKAIMLNLQTNEPTSKKGKGTWKVNNSLLNNEDILSDLKQMWKEWGEHKMTMNSIEWWEKGKKRVKSLLINKGIANKANTNREITNLERQLKTLHKELEEGKDVSGILRQTKNRLSEIWDHINEGVRVRARQQNMEKGEKILPISTIN